MNDPSKPGSKPYVVVGYGAAISDVIDLVHLNDGYVSAVLLNMPETKAGSGPTLGERLRRLTYTVPVIEGLDAFRPESEFYYVFGTWSLHKDRLVRDMEERFRVGFTTLVHPETIIGSSVSIGAGAIINAKVVVGPGASIESYATINRCAMIGHDVHIGRHARIGPNAAMAGSARIGHYATIGMSASVLERTRIGDWTVVGAGSLVTKDLADRVVAYGVPARVVRPNGDAPALSETNENPILRDTEGEAN